MPFHRYECGHCGAQFRVLHHGENGGKGETTCPRCEGTSVKRLLPRIGVIYKGSGYYSTDHGNKKTKIGRSAKEDVGRQLQNRAGKEPAAATTKADNSED